MRTEYSLGWISRSRTKILPDVGGSTPVRTLIRVDLPAPLSPMSPTISLRPMAILMSRSACTAPKCFWTPSMRTMDAKSPSAAIIGSNPETILGPRMTTPPVVAHHRVHERRSAQAARDIGESSPQAYPEDDIRRQDRRLVPQERFELPTLSLRIICPFPTRNDSGQADPTEPLAWREIWLTNNTVGE